MPAPNAREQAALDWFSRCDRGLSPEKEAEFEAWLTADPRHAEIFNELAGTWNLLGAARTAEHAAQAPARRRRTVRWLSPLAVAAALALAYFAYWRPAHYSTVATTEVGAQLTQRLPDGTVVTLNTDSVVAAAFSPEERRVRLVRGEASFAVAKNPARPFVVEACGVDVRAVGTSFNVRLAARSVEVLVLEGRVQVSDAATGASLLAGASGHEAPVLTPGQQIVVALPEPQSVPPAAVVSMISAGEVQRRNAWQQGRLEFENAPLSAIVAEFNRYNRHKLVVADEELAASRFGGAFKPDDPEGLVRMLMDNFSVQVEQLDGVTVLRPAR